VEIEEWRVIPSAINYEASSLGRIRSLPRRRARGGIKAETLCNGYRRVTLSIKNKMRMVLVHRLVLEAFRGSCPDGFEGSHLDGSRINCRIENLVWEGRSDNHARKASHGTSQRGSNIGTSKLKEIDIPGILASPDNAVKVALRYRVDAATIRRIRRRETWTHVAAAGCFLPEPPVPK